MSGLAREGGVSVAASVTALPLSQASQDATGDQFVVFTDQYVHG